MDNYDHADEFPYIILILDDSDDWDEWLEPDEEDLQLIEDNPYEYYRLPKYDI
jgi:hypothetical protein